MTRTNAEGRETEKLTKITVSKSQLIRLFFSFCPNLSCGRKSNIDLENINNSRIFSDDLSTQAAVENKVVIKRQQLSDFPRLQNGSTRATFLALLQKRESSRFLSWLQARFFKSSVMH